MIVIVAGKSVKGPVTIDIANNEGAEPLSSAQSIDGGSD